MRKLSVVLIAVVAIFAATAAQAQTFDWLSQQDPSTIQQSQLDEQVESLLKLFSALAGAGYVNSAALHQVGGFDIRATFVGTPVPDEFKDIIPTLKDPLEGADFIPFAFLHGNVGLPANFEVFARFFTLPIKGDPSGNVTLLGGGLKYGILRGNAAMPDLTVLAGYETILVPDAFDFGSVSTLSLKAYVSKGFPFFTLYGGGGIDRTALSLNIPGLPPDINKDYDVVYPQGTVGVTLSPFPLFKVNLDANLGEFTSVVLGAAISFR